MTRGMLAVTHSAQDQPQHVHVQSRRKLHFSDGSSTHSVWMTAESLKNWKQHVV